MKRLKDAWLVVGITIFCLAACEVSARLFYVVKERGLSLATMGIFNGKTSQRDYIAWEPYTYWKSRPFVSKGINVSAEGYRKTIQPGVSADGVLKIFMFGGSALWGLYLLDNETIPSFLAQELIHKDLSNFRITNFAQIGYVSTQEIIQLLMELRKGNIPDIVIFYDGVNDTWSAFQNRRAGLPLNEENRRKEFESYATGTMLLWHYVTNSALLRAVNDVRLGVSKIQAKFFLHPPSPGVDQGCYDALVAHTLHTYAFNMNLVRLLAQAYGFEYFFFWQPTVFSMDKISASDGFNKQKYAVYNTFFNCVYSKVPSLKSFEQNFYDLQKVLGSIEESFFFDFCHTKPNANKIIAQHIADRVTVDSKKLQRDR